MIGGDSKLVFTCTHVHMFPHTHTQLISRNGKEIEITHTLAKWGSGSRKKVKDLTHTPMSEFSTGVNKSENEKKEREPAERKGKTKVSFYARE